uniref:Malectin domain-containing protein n=1 Tax=Cucumis melo TaxID=3656 RepID=A0A9I9EDZ4_CUCME
ILNDNNLRGEIPRKWGYQACLYEITEQSPIRKDTFNTGTFGQPDISVRVRNQTSDFKLLEWKWIDGFHSIRDWKHHYSYYVVDFLPSITLLESDISENADLKTGSGLSGLLPSEIGLLTKLTKLIISDLNGASSPFPPLANLYNMEYLILRSCNIMDVLPSYLDVMGNLTILSVSLIDLSFNKISGQIPSYFYSLARVENMIDFVSQNLPVECSFNSVSMGQFLTGNLLNGSVPEWMLETGNNIIPIFKLCNRQEFVNSYSLHINCGGKEVTISGTTFEGDVDPGEPSVFVSSKTNWGFSNTGLFLYDTGVSVDYIELNHSLNFPTPYSELYESARVSPISLTYYAYCLGNGNYRISLHFSEIVLTNDTKLGGHGRRVFNIYIQGKLVVKDFNIVDAAGGILKPVIKRIPVAVTSNTVEIRFYWAGKGTFLTIENNTGYGPLISAISIELGSAIIADFWSTDYSTSNLRLRKHLTEDEIEE